MQCGLFLVNVFTVPGTKECTELKRLTRPIKEKMICLKIQSAK